ncbi:purine nucleoside phosphorylase DeoD-type [Mycoplasma sp. ES3157-GEN-MYC]|uniref:Uridine phosphorylase n=1 Tax=Mycoplasma miroungigenitalium TaxID=754515 RepID=A0A6M4JBE9_9MOLU|nr:purine nucleoside phosphorylase DeoD-type [Mycoplasma miroungigenitalium]MBU4690322.1 purine nucleoside phosphorylase DeoD-type [Mycoplasma miroungigenitalium]MBU4691589.1 purine nucleoside phosphorylase DeoD-type [Mycoplasma miroungigenitalium]QJR43417.1 purine nucleoside phosphorylase DeoD-type [Mycoplasma miroungigenitalium]
MPTPHISAQKGEIAKYVLMPGDPLRAEYMAKKFLKNPKLVSSVRNVLFYTGEYNGMQVTIGASGMGAASIGIYAYELYTVYGVEQIIRVGSTGSYIEELNVKQPVLVNRAYADGFGFVELMVGERTHEMFPTKSTMDSLIEAANDMGVELKQVSCHTTDVFYGLRSIEETKKVTQCQVVDNECFALFATALRCNKKAGALLSVSENIVTGASLSSDERLLEFSTMFEIALNSLSK